jgi:cysteinyl-tRNA synthetase
MSQLKIYNTLRGQLEDFIPLEGNRVKMYVCGPTVYDDAHLGHARCYIIWDVVARYLRFKGYDLLYVRNITDVDDKIIGKAKKQNVTPETITAKYIEDFARDMKTINVKTPDIEPRATQFIEEMIDITRKLIDKGHAYVVNGDVFFRVESYKHYGELSKQNIEDLKSGARVESDIKKENPIDFALWKTVSSEEEISWQSPWGKGRPGWHTECCAMILKHMGETIDIHAGGYDLTFPHHENERAQVECLTGKPFVKYWLHNGFVNVDSEKMSKSLENFKTIKELAKTYDNNTIRLFILTNHYRMPVDFRDEALNSAKKGIKRIKNALQSSNLYIMEKQVSKEKAEKVADKMLEHMTVSEIPESIKDDFPELAKIFCSNEICGTSPWARSEFISLTWRIKEFITAMDNDFNTSKALAILFSISSMIQKNKTSIEEGKKLNTDVLNLMLLETVILERLSTVLGFDFSVVEHDNTADNELPDQLMNVIIELRAQARKDKNWALADAIRDKLKAINIVLKDTKDGTTTWELEEE